MRSKSTLHDSTVDPQTKKMKNDPKLKEIVGDKASSSGWKFIILNGKSLLRIFFGEIFGSGCDEPLISLSNYYFKIDPIVSVQIS
jgi:hypothetical protein